MLPLQSPTSPPDTVTDVLSLAPAPGTGGGACDSVRRVRNAKCMKCARIFLNAILIREMTILI